jgi:hypothetical protein
MPQSDPLAPAPATTPAATPAPAAAAPLTAGDADRLLNAIEGWSQKVIKAIPQAPAAPAKPTPTSDDDALTSIAAESWRPIERRIEEGVTKVIQNTLVPYMGARASDDAAANESAARAAIDAEFGPGAYDSEFKSRVDELFDGQTATRSVRSQFDRAIQLVKGEKFSTLADRRGKIAADKAAADKEAERVARNAPYMPGGGYRGSPAGEGLSDDDREQLKTVRNATGRAPSEEDAVKMRDLVMRSRNGKVSLDDFNETFPLPKA